MQGHGRSPSCPELRHCDTTAYQLREQAGHLWIAARATPAPMLPQLAWDDFRAAGSVTTLVRAPLDVTLDNISEDEHFPFIHSSFGWSADGLAEVTLDTINAADHSQVRYGARQRASPWALLGGVRAGDHFHNRWTTRFDPVHAIYTFGWRDARGRERPITTRAAVFLVPETATTTRIHMFLFLRIAPSLYRAARPAIAWLARHISGMELARDVRLIESVAGAPRTLAGMRLTRFDKALIHNRKLLHALYWGNGDNVRDFHLREEQQ
jgi:phenylpropionate dioxygenase-like ring-hydroxylating dioxygenase large terminal subunit